MSPRPLSSIVADIANEAFPRGGFYVEAGAHDGIFFSNTNGLDTSKWQGLLVEPSPAAFELLKRNRPEAILENVALVEDESITSLSGTFEDGSAMGSADRQLMQRDAARPRNLREKLETIARAKLGIPPMTRTAIVNTATLDQLLEKHRIESIDLLILDVEGYEAKVLDGFRFVPKPKLMIVEMRQRDCFEISTRLLASGYILAANLSNLSVNHNPLFSGDHQDFAWVRSDCSDLLKVVADVELFS